MKPCEYRPSGLPGYILNLTKQVHGFGHEEWGAVVSEIIGLMGADHPIFKQPYGDLNHESFRWDPRTCFDVLSALGDTPCSSDLNEFKSLLFMAWKIGFDLSGTK